MKSPIFLSALVFLGHIFAWFQSNSAVILKNITSAPIICSFILAPASGLIFAYATKYLYELTGSIWSVRFISFCIGYFVFIPLSWYFYDESPLTLKNILCILLCISILTIQYIMK